MSYEKFVELNFSHIEEYKKNIELIGFNITPHSLSLQLGTELSSMLFEIINTSNIADRLSTLEKTDHLLRDCFNIPEYWNLEMLDTFLKILSPTLPPQS